MRSVPIVKNKIIRYILTSQLTEKEVKIFKIYFGFSRLVSSELAHTKKKPLFDGVEVDTKPENIIICFCF